ncbi:hypothetical protein JHD50_03205 [Sulfurimonas sp. MAG313]|nr:hypothetical protein [Sulfurimonas sp. MAG313]MDF1880320.1 hypothetical protein [Sulfurimonas sp. MAG313]
MTQLQEDFLNELKSNPKFTTNEFAVIYAKHIKIAIQDEEKNGADETRAKAMGNYYTVAILSNFIANENKLSRIIAAKERL